MTRHFIYLLVLMTAACTAEPTLAPVHPATASAQTETVYFMTTRAAAGDDTLFSDLRAFAPSFGAVVVGIPPMHQVGQVEVTDGTPDPTRHFHRAGLTDYDDLGAFADAITGDAGPVMIYVHGYNNTFAESIFRYAQIAHDAELPGKAVQFAWASKGDANGYIYDRDSALAARDDLADLLMETARRTDQPIMLVAHSMGSLLAMEALLHLSVSGDQRTLGKVTEVMLLSPDLDADVFADQLAQIRLPSNRFGVAINREDRLLRLSGRIAGQSDRVGRDLDAETLSRLGIRVVDLTGVRDGDRAGHFLPATSPTILEYFRSSARPIGS